MKVYLAGPITGVSFGESTDWRAYFAENVGDAVACVSPMRGKAYLSQESSIRDSYEHIPLSSARGITTRDRWDSTRCDVLVANVLGASRVSIGTVMEMAWADACRIPIVLVIEEESNPHDHAMVGEIAGFRVTSLDEAISVVRAIS